jgi:2-methylcitrate dehydratase PrpD
VSYKPWPSCRGTHPFIEAALELVRNHDLTLDNIESVELTASSLTRMLCEPFEQKQRPVAAIDAKFSVPFVTASAMVHRRISLDSFSAERLADPLVLSLTRRMSYKIDTGADFKAALSGTVSLATKDGRTRSVTVERPRGNLESPMTEADLLEKFCDCCSYHARPMARDLARGIAATVLDTRAMKTLTPLWRAISPT